MHRLDSIVDHSFGLFRTFESCVQPKIFQRAVKSAGAAAVAAGGLDFTKYSWSPPKNVDLRGKVAVVTGGSSGVAKEVARDLASRGATVYCGCRRTHLCPTGTYHLPPGAARAAGTTLSTTSTTGPGRQQRLDLQSAQGSAATAVMAGSSRLSPAGRVLEAAGKVDILVLCAAIAGKPYKLSPQGFEIHYATNFLGHFALTQHLLPSLLEQHARVVVVSSMLHSFADDAGPDFRYPSWPALLGLSGGWWAYCRSNLAKTWFGYELQRRHPELTVPLCHPGVIDSGLTVVPTELLQRIKASLLISPSEGAKTPLYCALSPDAKGFTFYHNVLGIINSSAASYDVNRQVPHYDAAMDMVKRGSSSNFAARAARPAAVKQNGARADGQVPPAVQLVEKAADRGGEVADVGVGVGSRGPGDRGGRNMQ
eukprot:gene7691-7891_t